MSVKQVPIRVQWNDARGERNFELMQELGEQLLEKSPDDDLVLRATARLFDRLGKADQSITYWTRLRDSNPNNFEAAFHVARARIAEGKDAAEAVSEAAPDANDVFHGAMIGALESPAPIHDGPFKHVAICGVAYCGSTVLDRVLGGLPNVKSIGESHWLTKCRIEDRYGEVDMSVPIEDVIFVPCTVCRHRCEVLTREFRRSLAADGSNWYRKVAHQLQTDILVSADKNVPKLLENDPLLEMSALVVFKSPAQAWFSHRIKLPADRPRDFYLDHLQKYLRVWNNSYRGYLDHFQPQGDIVFLNFDAFTHDPEAVLRSACLALGLEFDPQVLVRTVPGHAIGGNSNAMRRLRDKDYAVVIEPLEGPDLPEHELEIIAADDEVQQTFADLMTRYRRLVDVGIHSSQLRQAS